MVLLHISVSQPFKSLSDLCVEFFVEGEMH